MPQRFHARVAHLKLLAAAAGWRVALTDLHVRLAEVETALTRFGSKSDPATPITSGQVDGLYEARCAIKNDFRTLETALADAQVRMRALEAP